MKREIEKKYLIKDLKSRDELVSKLYEKFPKLDHSGRKTIISYFYERGIDKKKIITAATKMLNADKLAELNAILVNSTEQVVKCRSIDDVNYFTVKGSGSGEDPVHAVNRLEFEVSLELELEEINHLLQEAGINIVSKWSSVRDFYDLDSTIKADIEFVAGYGYKAEFEILINDGESPDLVIKLLDELAGSLGLVEANGKLLAKMYEYYNNHWQEYFKTDKVFDDKIWKSLVN